MSRRAPIALPPTRADLAISHAFARRTNSRFERGMRVATWLADEKLVLAATAAIWIAERVGASGSRRREADRMLLSVMIAGAVPHVFKLLVRRRRPDRSLVRRGHRHGIPRSGNAWDSFPSGHAVHLGAVAGSLARLSPSWLRPAVLPVLAVLASTRVALLAHYASDVIAGWGLGALIARGSAKLYRRLAPNGFPNRHGGK